MGCPFNCNWSVENCEEYFKQYQSDWDEINVYAPGFIQNKPNLSGIGAQSDWSETDAGEASYIKNKPDLSRYAQQSEVDNLTDVYFQIVEDLGEPLVYDYGGYTLLEFLGFNLGVNYVSTLVNLPTTKGSVVATVGTDETLSLDGVFNRGFTINIKVVATANLKITLPASSNWVLMDVSELDLTNGDIAEINIWCTEVNEFSVKTLVKS